ncbi:hypothetical protein BH23ACT9_BH23ACT9_38880 [soil metagenome]
MLVAAVGEGVPVALVAGLAGTAIGFGCANVAMTDRVTIAAPAGAAGVTLGVYNMVQFAGGAVGSAMVGGLSGLLPVNGALAVTALLPAAAALLAITAPRRVTSIQAGVPGGRNSA